eukprot:scaffold174155_cov19-Tisochrysis_lutea.AAC.1
MHAAPGHHAVLATVPVGDPDAGAPLSADAVVAQLLEDLHRRHTQVGGADPQANVEKYLRPQFWGFLSSSCLVRSAVSLMYLGD